MSGTGLARAAFHCYPVLKVVIGCIPFFLKWEEMVVEGGTKKPPFKLKNYESLKWDRAQRQEFRVRGIT